MRAYDQILTMLLESGSQYLSGQIISKRIGISRAAIWKHVQTMQEKGWEIESVTRLGYRIINANRYTAAGITACLDTEWMGKSLIYLDTVDSTNNRLKQLAADNAPEGTVVVADQQTSGRGRIGRTWASEKGCGIWMSVLLRPQMAPQDVQSLTLVAAVAVVEAILSCSGSLLEGRIGIKWPNDILIDGKKVCGILTEMGAEADAVSWVVVGMGINVHHRQEQFPEEIRSIATSLAIACSSFHWNRNHLVSAILKNIENFIIVFVSSGFSDILERWRKYSITLGCDVLLTGPNGTVQVRAVDVLPDGRLLVEKADGERMAVLSGEISLRPTSL